MADKKEMKYDAKLKGSIKSWTGAGRKRYMGGMKYTVGKKEAMVLSASGSFKVSEQKAKAPEKKA